MGFSADLLDGFDVLYRRTEGVLKVGTEMATFFKKLAIIEADHAKLLAKLSFSYGQKKLLSNPHVDGTVQVAWEAIFKSLDTVAAKQETFAHSLMKEVSMAMSDFVKDKDVVRKKLTADGQKLTKDMKTQLETLTKVRGNYIKLSKESDAATIAINKEISGANQPKRITQLQQKAAQAAERAAASDQEYQDSLKQTNVKQQDHYLTEMPNLLNEFQQFEEERITFTKTILSRYGTLLLELPPIYQECFSGVSQESAKIDHVADLDKFIQENKTGITPPPPMEYQPHEVTVPPPILTSSPSSSSVTGSPAISPSKGSGFMKAPAQREWGLTPSDEGLSTEQKRQKLEQQLTELDALIRSESTAKNGVEKLVQFYASDPVAQGKAESELADAERKIKSMTESKKQVKAQLVELNGSAGNANYSDSSGASEGGAAGSSANGGAGQNGTPAADAEKVVIVKVRGLFDYEATCDTELSFKEGDILVITEQDESGWWYAEVAGRAGFVPQNYVEIIKD